ncbi:dihydroxyacetone kinase subunit DhaL [Acidocella aminolytica]|jgi:dihydroxyacetone kinase-like protein|uniref:Dihydroxyacetone kinase subunit DhaL n=1 Tax=Acidocella aminolytica 101 = DSM 11237 TaxID=1120923 RepID=A0A0D6PKQ2_9PROT|nr:dihydroxyacetone kinase subunit DhaL [Acidocella aminolytica]GAN81324.1 dihydroxyacetone kinase subunit DhaL [Acidocella aminolytica 101 = DSM 11237]GBQ42069.1 dihydroxyacetone kinase [Acidocella aminolytica 101 = DSM 11237]SHF49848.1 dihydroxyacetone kinase DhaL subunit [Acidocella aminolytica 101 = DSM 11237]
MSELLDVPVLTAWLKRADEMVAARQTYLSDLDAAIGDGDHGANLARGFHAVTAKLGTPADPAALFKTVGMTLIGTVGGASGPLYGSMFVEMGKAAAGKSALDAAAWADVLEAGVKGVAARGKAVPGEKTMLDALTPAVAAAKGAAGLSAALSAAAEAALQGAEATVSMIARKGRASYLGERSAGHADPGATSAALLLSALAEAAR